MKTLLAALLFLSTVAHAADSFRGWIIGQNYLLQWQGTDGVTDGSFQMQSIPIEAKRSHAFDPRECRLWLTDGKGTQTTYLDASISPAGSVNTPPGDLVSPQRDGYFYYLEADRQHLHRRMANGKVSTNVALTDGDKLVWIEPHGEIAWGLFFDSKTNRIWLKQFDVPDFTVRKEIPVSMAKVIWANPRLRVNLATGEAWVGYSSSAGGLSTTPMVKRFLPDGTEGSVFSWGQRGLFFDQCEEGDHMLAARDLPTPPYTVPVFSFIDELVPGAKPKRQYAAPDNYFIDSMSCREKSFWMVQRSIFGSDGSYLAGYDRAGAKEILRVKLQGPAEQLYRCE